MRPEACYRGAMKLPASIPPCISEPEHRASYPSACTQADDASSSASLPGTGRRAAPLRPASRAAACLGTAVLALALTACAPRGIVSVPEPAGLSFGAICPTVAFMGRQLTELASTQLGVPYRLGGDSPEEGFDCSGLVSWAYENSGYAIPRTTVGQEKAGIPISKDAMLPGDIIVFTGVRTAPNRRHSGIYLGDGRFIHSPNSRSHVRIDRLDTGYWSRLSYSVRRVLKAPPCDGDGDDPLSAILDG